MFKIKEYLHDAGFLSFLRIKNSFLLWGIFIFSGVLFSGCSPTVRLGDFTAASSFNVRNLNYDQLAQKRVKGESCGYIFLLIRFGEWDRRIQRAMDKAIKAGQKAGVGGDLLVNVRIESKPVAFGNCMVVTGDLVKIKSN